MSKVKRAFVTFEQAKKFAALKASLPWHKDDVYTKPDGKLLTDIIGSIYFDPDIHQYAYQQWEIVEWLRINHGMWVSVDVDKNRTERDYFFIITQKNNHSWSECYFKTPQEAYSAAFDYILKNML